MQRLTLGDVKDELRRVSGNAGVPIDDERLPGLVSLIQERLAATGEYPYQYDRIKFCQYGGTVALPTEYEAIVHTTVDRGATPIMDSWYEFIGYGPGPQDKNAWVNVGIDRGESPVYRQPGARGMKVRATSTYDERVDGVRPVISVMGYDENGVWIRSDREDGKGLRDGIDLELRGDIDQNTVSSSVKFSKVTQVVKPVTRGDVVLSYDDTLGTIYQGARYRHYDKNPSFRIYQFPIAEDKSRLIHAIVRRRIFPLLNDTDQLVISSMPALRLGAKVIAMEDKDDFAGAGNALAGAIQILQQESHRHKTSQPKPPVQPDPTMGFDTPAIY